MNLVSKRAWRCLLLIASTLLIAACAGGPKTPQAPLEQVTLTQSWIEGASGEKLRLNTWRARGSTKAVLIALHGYGDHGVLTYGAAAKYWSTRGITTYAYDQRGFGHNPSYRKWAGPRMMIDDLQSVTRAIRARHPEATITVLGHSMGGGVTLAAAGKNLAADRLILAGPAIAGDSEVNPFIRIGGWALGFIAPDKRFTGEGIVAIRSTDNNDALRAASADPRSINNPSGRELFGLLRLMDRAAMAAPQVTQSTLTLMGAKDQVFKPAAIKRIHDRIPAPSVFKVYPNGWHWLFRDHQAKTVWQDVASFALTGD